MKPRSILVAGVGGAVGFEIVKSLRAKEYDVVATYRTSRASLDQRLRELGAQTAQWDIADQERGRALLADVDAAIFTPILTVSEKAAALAGDKPLVFFSSNNVEIDPEAAVYAELLAAEKRVKAVAPRATILRPTMIFGYPGDGNLSLLMRAMRRWPLLPIIGGGKALQQPVFFRDVADAAVECIETEDGGIMAVAGPTVLSQRDLYGEVRAAAGARCFILTVPAALAGAAVGIAQRTGVRLPLTTAQIERANRHKTPPPGEAFLGPTTLETGLRTLAKALDDQAAGA